METPRRTQAQRSEATRGALLAAARRLFGERGFAKTGRELIVETAGVSRGAMYHHFASKEALFRAVFEEVEAEVATLSVTAAAAGSGPADALRRGCDAFLDACADPAVRQIVLIDAPAIMGWEEWRETEARYGLALLREGLGAAMAAGELKTAPVDPLAHLLLATLNEAAWLVAMADTPAHARAEVGATVRLLLDGLIAP